MTLERRNIDTETVKSFGDEWSRHDQSSLRPEEAERIFKCIFRHLSLVLSLVLVCGVRYGLRQRQVGQVGCA